MNRSTSAILRRSRPRSTASTTTSNLPDDYRALANTLLVSCIATVMAVVFGFLQAWILTRTNIPGRAAARAADGAALLHDAADRRARLGRAAAARRPAWSTSCGGSLGAPGDLFNIYSPWGIAWVMALFEGTVAFVMISAAMKSMDPSLEESSRVLGAGKLRTALTRHPAVGRARRAQRHDLRVRRDARLVRRRLRAGHSRPLLS